MRFFWTFVLAAIIAFFGRFVGGIYLLIIGFAGMPGGLLTISSNRFVKQCGKILNVLGACYALIAFVAFVVALNRYFMDMRTFLSFPFWVEAFAVAYSPVWYGYVEIRGKHEQNESLAPMQEMWWLMSYVVLVSFFAFMFVNHFGPWEWVTSPIRYFIPKSRL